ncbi:hypothetical protein ANO11243_073180 [Dothideomycetidae sp. 11243]|nr:hypothetical protein ANO11243_073180 [fungal sp. No.11243]
MSIDNSGGWKMIKGRIEWSSLRNQGFVCEGQDVAVTLNEASEIKPGRHPSGGSDVSVECHVVLQGGLGLTGPEARMRAANVPLRGQTRPSMRPCRCFHAVRMPIAAQGPRNESLARREVRSSVSDIRHVVAVPRPRAVLVQVHATGSTSVRHQATRRFTTPV